jgi:hypothetical protein
VGTPYLYSSLFRDRYHNLQLIREEIKQRKTTLGTESYYPFRIAFNANKKGRLEISQSTLKLKQERDYFLGASLAASLPPVGAAGAAAFLSSFLGAGASPPQPVKLAAIKADKAIVLTILFMITIL